MVLSDIATVMTRKKDRILHYKGRISVNDRIDVMAPKYEVSEVYSLSRDPVTCRYQCGTILTQGMSFGFWDDYSNT